MGDTACSTDTDQLTCDESVKHSDADATKAVTRILGQPEPRVLDTFAPMRQLADQLTTMHVHYAAVWVRAPTALHTARPVDLAQANLAHPESIVDQIVRSGAWIADCKGWHVHVVAPTTGDPGRDRGLRGCGPAC